MKKIVSLLILIVVFMPILVIGCKTETSINTGNGGSVSYGNNVSIPNSYPKDILPLYKNGKVISAVNQDDGAAVIMVSKNSVAKISEFYKEKLEGATLLYEVAEENQYSCSGTIEDYTFVLGIMEESEMKGYESSITISVAKGAVDMGGLQNIDQSSIVNDSQSLTDVSNYQTKEGTVLPEDYPINDFPIMGGSKSLLSKAEVKQDPSGREVHIIMYASMLESDEMIKLLENKYGESEGFNKRVMHGDIAMDGIYNQKTFSIMVGRNVQQVSGANNEYKSMVQIVYYK